MHAGTLEGSSPTEGEGDGHRRTRARWATVTVAVGAFILIASVGAVALTAAAALLWADAAEGTHGEKGKAWLSGSTGANVVTGPATTDFGRCPSDSSFEETNFTTGDVVCVQAERLQIFRTGGSTPDLENDGHYMRLYELKYARVTGAGGKVDYNACWNSPKTLPNQSRDDGLYKASTAENGGWQDQQTVLDMPAGEYLLCAATVVPPGVALEKEELWAISTPWAYYSNTWKITVAGYCPDAAATAETLGTLDADDGTLFADPGMQAALEEAPYAQRSEAVRPQRDLSLLAIARSQRATKAQQTMSGSDAILASASGCDGTYATGVDSWRRGEVIDGARELHWTGRGSRLVPASWLGSARRQLSDRARDHGYDPTVRAFARTSDYFLVVQLGSVDYTGAVVLDLLAAPVSASPVEPDLRSIQRTVGKPTVDGEHIDVTVSAPSLATAREGLVPTPGLTAAQTDCEQQCRVGGTVAFMASAAFCGVTGVAGCGQPLSFLTCGPAIGACSVFSGAAYVAADEHCDRCEDVERCGSSASKTAALMLDTKGWGHQHHAAKGMAR